jgi:hypothetical protein
MEAIAAAFERTLTRIGSAIHESFAGASVSPRWGVAGLREEALVFLLAESMRALRWSCEYERSYGDGSGQRVDLDAAKDGARLWIEAKWWWSSNERLPDVLAHDREKLSKKRGTHRPVAVVFTVDAEGPQEECDWTLTGAKQWFKTSKLPEGWKFVGCSTVASPYVGWASGDRKPENRQGVFAAAFFELKG